MSRFGSWGDPTTLVDVTYIFILLTLTLAFVVYKKLGKKNSNRRNYGPLSTFVLVVLCIYVSACVVLLCMTLYMDSNLKYWEDDVSASDTDATGNTTYNATITRIGFDARYENEHTMLIPFPDLEEDIYIIFEDDEIYGNETMDIYIEAKDSLGNCKENRTASKTLTDLDSEYDSIKVGSFEKFYSIYTIGTTYNDNSDTDTIYPDRTNKVITFTV